MKCWGSEAGDLGRPPRRSRAQEVLGSRGSCACGAAAATPEPGTLAAHPRRLGFLSSGRRAPTPPLAAPPSSTVEKKK
ncbi:Phytanoyl-CoA dioxygenase, peroxisomal [Manis javanica]|nr:Phytanoyl-CoA dioxygenase, peroxisomal [Manis javanica]